MNLTSRRSKTNLISNTLFSGVFSERKCKITSITNTINSDLPVIDTFVYWTISWWQILFQCNQILLIYGTYLTSQI